MDMLPLEAGAAPTATTVAGHATVQLTPARLQLIGVRTELAEARACSRALRLPARVEVDENGLSAVSLKTSGWVEELSVRSVGARVEAGQPLFKLYSPELFEAQRKYALAYALVAQDLVAGRAEIAKRQQVEATRARLALWDLSDEQIRALEVPGAEPQGITPILARTSGVVLTRNIVLGARVDPGVPLLELADLTRVWVLASVHESELALVHTGQAAEIELDARPGQSYSGSIDYVYPLLDPATRTAKVRVVVENPAEELQPGMSATLQLQLTHAATLAVDDEAVLDTGSRALLFVELTPGEFEPREVVITGRCDGRVHVEGGLEEGERVVASGAFLIDSESRMKAALATFAPPAAAAAHTSSDDRPGH
jgi:RND family efflux transporter MFP subunit